MCGRCNATYYGESCQDLSARVGEHSCVSHLTGKMSKSKKSTATKGHMLFCDHIVSIDDFWQPVTQISMLRSNKAF